MGHGTGGTERKRKRRVVAAPFLICMLCIPVYTALSELLELVRVICLSSSMFRWNNVVVTLCLDYLTHVGFVQRFSSAIFLFLMRSVLRSVKYDAPSISFF